MRLDDVGGFVFDVDGTLVHRDGGTAHVVPGARELLERIRESGRPFVVFTNGSHLPPAQFASGLRDVGLPVDDGQMLTPLCSMQAYLGGSGRRGAKVLPFVTEPARAYLVGEGVNLVDFDHADEADIVFVAHIDHADLPELEKAAFAVIGGARLLTGSYVAAYAGANGPILSRGAMVTAAIAKASSARPTIVGKPSKAAVRAVRKALGVPTEQIAVVGDDLFMDVALGHMGGSKTVLVRSGISAEIDLSRVPEKRRPHATVTDTSELLDLL